MATLTQIFNKDNATYDTAKIEEVAGSLQLKIVDNTGQTYTQDYASDTGFTYDSDEAEFSGGLVQQKDTTPSNATLQATFPVDEDSDFADGSTNNTLIGGATWNSGVIDLTGNSGKRLNMPGGGGNFDVVGSAGCIRFTYIPDHNGNPASTDQILEFDAATGNNNAIFISRNTGGNFVIDVRDSVGTAHQFVTSSLSAVLGQRYVCELNFDFSSTTRFFVDGDSLGSLNTSPWTRAAESGTFKWGGAGGNGRFSLDEVVLFDAVQHTANHAGELPYSYNLTRYVETKVDLPAFTYSGVGSVQAFTNLVTVGSSDQYIMDGNYWTGAAWAVSDGSRAQSNTTAVILANIATMPVSDSFVVSVVFAASNTVQGNADNLILTYTGQIYPIDNPTITFTVSVRMDLLVSFTEASTKPVNTAIQEILKRDSAPLYVPAGVWTTSDETYAQTSPATDIDTYASTFTTTDVTMDVVVYMNSDGSDTPVFTSITVEYDPAHPEPETIEKTTIFFEGIKVGSGSISQETITIAPLFDVVKYKNRTIGTLETQNIVLDAEGKAEVDVVENDNMSQSNTQVIGYKITINNVDRDVYVENSSTPINFWDLQVL